jgi:hypothetical protein
MGGLLTTPLNLRKNSFPFSLLENRGKGNYRNAKKGNSKMP